MTVLLPSYFHNGIFHNGNTLNQGLNRSLPMHTFVFVCQWRQMGWLVFSSLFMFVYDVELLSVTCELGSMTQSEFPRGISHTLLFNNCDTERLISSTGIYNNSLNLYGYNRILLQVSHATIMLKLLSYHSLLSFGLIPCFEVTFSSATNSTIRQDHIHVLQQYVKGELPENALLDAEVTILPGQVFRPFSGLKVKVRMVPSSDPGACCELTIPFVKKSSTTVVSIAICCPDHLFKIGSVEDEMPNWNYDWKTC